MRTKDAQKIILKAHKETTFSWISLTSRTASQLVINASRLMTFSTQNIESTGSKDLLLFCSTKRGTFLQSLSIRLFRVIGIGGLTFRHHLWIPAEDNICTTASHIGRNSEGALTTSLGHNFSFPIMLLGIQYVMSNPSFLEHLRQGF